MPSPDEADLVPQPSSRVKLAAFQVSQPVSIHGDAAAGEGLLQWLASILADAEAWLEASARDYQSVIVRRLANPPPTTLGAPKVQAPPVLTPSAEAERLREAEARRAAEEARRQEQLAKAEAEARRASEAEARRKAAEEARRQQELAKAEAETKRKVAEAQRLAEAEAKRKAVDEARRRQDLARAEEEVARKTAEARRLAEAEAKRQEADDLRRQQELAKAEAEAQRIAAAELRRLPQSAEPPASQEQGARSMSVAAPAPLGTTKRTALRKARRDKPQLVRYTGVTAGSGNWCDFFQYSYPMELLDPGHWLSASAGRR
jgi:colicin import membrane protein